MILGAVTIRERVERVRIEDPFVVDQFVVFGTRSGAELILFGIPVHALGLDDGGDTWLGLRCPEFIQGALSEDLIVELGLSFGVEGETADLAFGFPAGGHVAVVFGSSGTELDDVVAWVEFIGEITEKIPKRGLDGWIIIIIIIIYGFLERHILKALWRFTILKINKKLQKTIKSLSKNKGLKAPFERV